MLCGPLFIRYQIDLLGNLLIGFSQEMGSNLSPTLFKGPLIRCGTVQFMQITMPLWTNHAEISIRLGISLDLPKPSIFYGGEYPATVTASITEGRNPCDRRFRACTAQFLKSRSSWLRASVPIPAAVALRKPLLVNPNCIG